jgi:hypothetical protein
MARKKKEKFRITMLFVCNADGSECIVLFQPGLRLAAGQGWPTEGLEGSCGLAPLSVELKPAGVAGALISKH